MWWMWKSLLSITVMQVIDLINTKYVEKLSLSSQPLLHIWEYKLGSPISTVSVGKLSIKSHTTLGSRAFMLIKNPVKYLENVTVLIRNLHCKWNKLNKCWKCRGHQQNSEILLPQFLLFSKIFLFYFKGRVTETVEGRERKSKREGKRERERERYSWRERYRKIFHMLVHSLNGCNIWH